MSSIARTQATGGALNPEFLRWQTSLEVDIRLLEVDVRGSVAHVLGLVDAGLLSRAEGKTLTEALERLPALVRSGEVELPLEEDVHMAVEAWLTDAVGEVAKKLHTGRSRNDQVATDLKLWCRDAVTQLRRAVDQVLEAARRFAESQGEVAMPAYTHRQVAIPVLARIWVDAAVIKPLQRDRALFDAVDAELRVSPLGAGAIGGTTLPIDTSVTANALGFARGPENPMDAIGQRDHATLLAFVCARVSAHLARFCVDVVELCADSLVTLSGDIACGSSMMPHKKNPDLFELVRGQAALRQGELTAFMSTFAGLGTGYHRDLQQDKQVLFAAVDGTLGSLRMIELGLAGITLDADACKRALELGDAIATDLTEALVVAGMAFRDAYGAVGALVAQQRHQGRRLIDLSPDDLEAAGLPREVHSVLDVAKSAHRRARRFE